tara:strand:- start:953 stop:1096 length:144 start_codon:yes stop_codon:yes gene_type:complete
MNKYIYKYDGRAIPFNNWIKEVPENWEQQVDEFGRFSWGYYSATKIK